MFAYKVARHISYTTEGDILHHVTKGKGYEKTKSGCPGRRKSVRECLKRSEFDSDIKTTKSDNDDERVIIVS